METHYWRQSNLFWIYFGRILATLLMGHADLAAMNVFYEELQDLRGFLEDAQQRFLRYQQRK